MKTLLQAKSFNYKCLDKHTKSVKKELQDSKDFNFIFKVIDSVVECSEENFDYYLNNNYNSITDTNLEAACNEVFDDEVITISFN